MKQIVLLFLLVSVLLADSIAPPSTVQLEFTFQPLPATNYSTASYSIIWNGVPEKEETANNQESHHREVALKLEEGINSLTFSKSDTIDISEVEIEQKNSPGARKNNKQQSSICKK